MRKRKKKPTANGGFSQRFDTPRVELQIKSNQNLVRRPTAVM